MTGSSADAQHADDGAFSAGKDDVTILMPTRTRRSHYARVWATIAIVAVIAAGLSIPFLTPVLRPGISASVGATAVVRGDAIVVTQSLVELAAAPYATVETVTSVPGLTLLGAWIDPVADGARAQLPAATSINLDAISNDPASVPPTGLPTRVHTGTYALTAAWQVTGCDQATSAGAGPPALILVNVFGSRLATDPEDTFPILSPPEAGSGPRWCELIREAASPSDT